MSLKNLPALPDMIHAEANDYAARCLAATAAVQARSRFVEDIPYGPDPFQQLDLYLPEASTPGAGSWPVLFFLHGGAWTSGTKEWLGFMAPPLISAPAILVSANYRLAPRTRYPAIVDDCFEALAWVHRHIAAHGGDPERLFVGGHSAGAHLAALCALDRARQQAHGLPASAIHGCLAISGTYDFRHREAAPGTMARRIYDTVLARPEDDEAASPICHVGPHSVPFFIAWGERDFDRLLPQAASMAARLRAAGVHVETMAIPGADHFGAHEVCGNPDSAWCATARRWLTRGPGA